MRLRENNIKVWDKISHLMRTDKAAKFCKVRAATVRTWVMHGFLEPVKRSVNGGPDDWHYYDSRDIKRIQKLRATYGFRWTIYVN